MLFTIGHSNHSQETFLELLRLHEVEVLADVRSQPSSRYSPHFNAALLKQALQGCGLKYVWLEELGGRPKEARYYDHEGHADYAAMSTAPFFLTGLERLKSGMARFRIALMCSEENPDECHRRLLIVKTLCEHDRAYRDEITHIRRGGRLETEADKLGTEQRLQPALWGVVEESKWRSPKPIR